MKGKAVDSHVLFGVVRENKMMSDWLRCIFFILLNIAKVFAESVAWSSTCNNNNNNNNLITYIARIPLI